MWILTPFGFFSVVQKNGEQKLSVRSRVYSDLHNLIQTYLPHSQTIHRGGYSFFTTFSS